MADNVTLDAGAGGDTIAADDVAGVKYQIVKIDVGADGAAALLGNANPIPVSDAGGSLTVDNAGLTALNGAISGTEVQADIVAALPAGTNNIGDVDVLSVVPGTGATNLGKAEDAQHTTGDTGVMALAVRQSTQTDFGADGDYVPLSVDDAGGVRVSVIAISGSQTDDAAFTPGTSLVSVIGAEFDNTLPDSVDEGDGGALRMSANRNLYVNIRDNAGNERGLNIDASGQLAATIASIAAGNNNIGDVDVASLPASTNTLEVVGDVAHDIAAAGNPVLIAGRATNAIEGLTQVAAADSSFLTVDLNGCAVTRTATTLEELIAGRQSNTDGTEDAITNFGAGGSGVHNYITSVTVCNTNTTTSGYVDILDGTGGTIIWTFPAPANGGATHNFDPPLKQPTANTGLFFDPSAAISTIIISLNGFQAQG